MKIVCITLPGEYEPLHGTGTRTPERTRAHFEERGVDAQFFYGLNAEKLGVDTTLVYENGVSERIGPKSAGCWLSHRALWAALLLLPDELFFILEDDARFPEDWRPRVDKAVADAGHFDMLFVGSCCTADKPKTHVAGDVYEVKWPMCLHGYIVRRSALEKMIATQDEARCYAPIDISVVLHTCEKLCVYTVLPRILDQFDTYLPE